MIHGHGMLTSIDTLAAQRVATEPRATLPRALSGDAATDVSRAEEVRQAFTDFVGQTFFGEMIKAMRSAQDKPAYFHGGRAEEVFQGQLDQTLAEAMSEASADHFVEPMFAQQFPQQVAALKSASPADGLDQLNQLRPR